MATRLGQRIGDGMAIGVGGAAGIAPHHGVRQAEQLSAEWSGVLRCFVDDQVRAPPLGNGNEVRDGGDRGSVGEHDLSPRRIALRSGSNRADLGEALGHVRRHPIQASGEMRMAGCGHIRSERRRRGERDVVPSPTQPVGHRQQWEQVAEAGLRGEQDAQGHRRHRVAAVTGEV